MKLVKEYCPSVQMVREMVSVQVNQLQCNLNQIGKNSQRSSSAYCNLIKLKDDIDQLLLTLLFSIIDWYSTVLVNELKL